MKSLTPLQKVKNEFESKNKLIESILNLMESKESGVKKNLISTSNKKLLKLYYSLSEVKKKFGSRENLVKEILSIKFKDRKINEDYKNKLNSFSPKTLISIYRGMKKIR